MYKAQKMAKQICKKNLFFTEYIYGHINVHIEKYVCMCVYRQAELIPYWVNEEIAVGKIFLHLWEMRAVKDTTHHISSMKNHQRPVWIAHLCAVEH